jgi:hypothetical protein
MAAISLFWYTNMAAVTSDENDLYSCSAVFPAPVIFSGAIFSDAIFS